MFEERNVQLQSSSTQKYSESGREDDVISTNGESNKTSRKSKKESLASAMKKKFKVDQDKVHNLNIIDAGPNPSEKKKKKQLALGKTPKENVIEADKISLKKKMKRKNKLGSLELEKRPEGTEIEGDTGKVKGSLKRKQPRYEMGFKETKTEADIDEVNGYNTMSKYSGGRSSNSDKSASKDALQRKKKKLNASESKRKTKKSKNEIVTGEAKNAKKTKKSRLDMRSTESETMVCMDEVEEISAVDDDHSKGMKKWLNEYWNSRPGLTVLQQQIDEFIVAHEAQEEQTRKEREALAAEGGWTVVVRHKDKKKTTDSETGISVGSVAPAAVLDNMVKKKKEIPLDFYRFQKREAQRNEVMMLQSKFEQDKKRIQQLRAARKFRPF